jgi:hypothetical protein
MKPQPHQSDYVLKHKCKSEHWMWFGVLMLVPGALVATSIYLITRKLFHKD